MMSVFVLTAEDQDRLQEAVRLALKTPIPLADVRAIKARSTTDEAGVVRGVRPDRTPWPQQVDLPLGWRVAISAEEQPIGVCLHVSMSTPTPKATLPNGASVEMLIRALGAANPITAWVEEFFENKEVGGRALNMLFIVPFTAFPRSE